MANPSVSFKVNLNKAAENILKKLQGYEGHVGVLSGTTNKDRKKGDPLNNAELAMVHEFGTLAGNIPARSFFRLTEYKRAKEMNSFIVSQRDNIMRKIGSGDSKNVMEKLCIKWLSYIHECFETEGWGTWLPLKPATLAAREKKRKDKSQGGTMILQDTGAMERSINFEVVKCSQK
jgi:phage gpG-like protein